MTSPMIVAAALFFTTPAPLDMPRAEGWLVTEKGVSRLEDRFDTSDLWYARTVTGCWVEEDGRRAFTLADLEFLPPAVAGRMTRTDYEGALVRPDRREPDHLLRQLREISPVAITADFTRSHQVPHGMKEVRYYEGTNLNAIVCAFRPENSDHWQAAIWELDVSDDREEMRRTFASEFWEELKANEKSRSERNPGKTAKNAKRRKDAPTEPELLKRDAAHSVAAYDDWHCSPGEDFIVLDDLKDGRSFVTSLTNDYARWRGRFAAALPTVINVSNTLSVARIYRNRDDFLLAAGEEMQWAAAYWCSSRRELVACLPPDGNLAELRKTFRHESFHQYLSFATAMVEVSPWLNEGYAQYFEAEERDTFDLKIDEEQWDTVELALPALLLMDYEKFYAGTDAERRTSYRLAWSVVYFIEHGMREIAHDPFRDFKRRYFEELARSRDMRKATLACFDSSDQLKLFCNEWKKFWMNRR